MRNGLIDHKLTTLGMTRFVATPATLQVPNCLTNRFWLPDTASSGICGIFGLLTISPAFETIAFEAIAQPGVCL